MELDGGGHYAVRDLDDGRSVYLDPLTFGRLRIAVGQTGTLSYSDGW